MVALFLIAAVAAVVLVALFYYARSDKAKVTRQLEQERARAGSVAEFVGHNDTSASCHGIPSVAQPSARLRWRARL
jgi:archaellin